MAITSTGAVIDNTLIWDAGTLFLGIFLGMIIMLVLVWILYNTRVAFFAYCPQNTPGCVSADYYNNPGEALAHDPRLTAADILTLDNQDQLLYKRVPKTNTCIPEENQTIQIIYPEYCLFSNGTTSVEYRQTYYGSNVYQPVNSVGPSPVSTDKNCNPKAGSGFTSGTPEVKWDPTILNS